MADLEGYSRLRNLFLHSQRSECAIAIIIVVFAAASLRGDLQDHCGRGGGEIRASDNHRAELSSASCAKKGLISAAAVQENVGNSSLDGDADQKISGERNFKAWLALSEETLHALRSPVW